MTLLYSSDYNKIVDPVDVFVSEKSFMSARDLLCNSAVYFCVTAGTVTMAFAQNAPLAHVYQGAHVGLDLGAAFGQSRRDFESGTTTGDFTVSGVIGGGEIGYDWRFGNLVVGAVADMSGSSVSGSAHAPNPMFTYDTTNHWIGTVRPRIGYLLGAATLPYVTGGFAVGDIEVRSYRTTTGSGGVDDSRVEPGWTLGAGIETIAFSTNWRIKAEYLRVSLSSAEVLSNVGKPTNTSFGVNIFHIGLGYAF